MTSREYFNAVLNAHISDELDAISIEFINRLDSRNKKRKSADSKDKVACRERKELVRDFLRGNKGHAFVRDQIAEAVGVTPSQVTAACKSLMTEGVLTKSEVKVDKSRKIAYTYATEE